MCQQKGSKTLPYKSINPYGLRFDLFFFSDVPHLLKTARNCFSNSFSHSKSRKMQVTIAIVKSMVAIIIIVMLLTFENQKNCQDITCSYWRARPLPQVSECATS